MPKFKLEGFHNRWIIFAWSLHSPSLITIICFLRKVFILTNRDKLNFENWRQKWFKHFVQIVNNSKTFMKTSHTHSLYFYFLIFRIATRRGKRAYLFKNKNLKNKSMVLLCYSILPYSTQVYAYFQWSLFRRSDSSMLILPTEKYNFMNARI